MIIIANKKEIITGIQINLTTDEVSHLIVAFSDYIRLMREHSNMHGGKEWKWIQEFKEYLEKERQ